MEQGESGSKLENPELRVVWRVLTIAAGAAIVGAVLLLGLFLLAVYLAVDWNQGNWPRLVAQHFAAIVGLPMGALAALIVVALFRWYDGPIEIEGLGVKLKGATGPVLLWALCFWVIAWAIKEAWVAGMR